jgi:5-methylcytosine-specific restriction endonuclease McrA
VTKAEKLERQRARAARWRAAHRDELRRYFAAYRRAHNLNAYYRNYYQAHKAKWNERAKREDVRATARAWRERTKDKRNAARREWDRRNPERARQIDLRRRERRREKKREADRVYRQQQRARCRASIARAKAAKPEKYRAIQAQSSLRRRARKRASVVERVSHLYLRERDGMRCHLCGLLIDGAASFDHLIPVARGGAHAEWNLMLAHLACNRRRGTRALFTPETRDNAELYMATRLGLVQADRGQVAAAPVLFLER